MNRLLLGNTWQDNSRTDISPPFDTKVYHHLNYISINKNKLDITNSAISSQIQYLTNILSPHHWLYFLDFWSSSYLSTSSIWPHVAFSRGRVIMYQMFRIFHRESNSTITNSSILKTYNSAKINHFTLPPSWQQCLLQSFINFIPIFRTIISIFYFCDF